MIEGEFVEVLVDAPLPRALTYRLPKNLAADARVGSRVVVPLGKRTARGILVGEKTSALSFSADKIKSIGEFTNEPPLGPKTLAWLKWLAHYYLYPPGQAYALAFAPDQEHRKRKSKKSLVSAPQILDSSQREAFNPNSEQKAAIDAITIASRSEQFSSFLLFGVTGSGKTEVYLQAIADVLARGKQALVLVPEISLTPQLISRFVARFGENVAVLHSHLTERERADQWWGAVRAKKQILVGARSALFCPLENLGLIVVDEEHEPSFKQEEQLKYNARDAAVMRGHYSNCPVVLGSATPSLESWQNALVGKYNLLKLTKRVEDRPLPQIDVVDMRSERKVQSSIRPYWMSGPLLERLEQTLAAGEQAALFLNRRGFAQFLLCPSCGHTESCPNCSVTLTAHKGGNQLTCHYCGFEKPTPSKCSDCKQDTPQPLGIGTEKISDELAVIFPKARIARADRDEIKTREDLENLLAKITNREIDIIVGTQMIAKGHDFPALTLVGVIAADQGLHFPDLRSSERTFQLLTQVAGRAGRHKKPGSVIIQTFVPEHPAVSFSTRHDFEGFAAQELTSRTELGYPPFGKLAVVRLTGPKLNHVEVAAAKASELLRHLQNTKTEFAGISILGPCESAFAKLRNNYRYQLLLKDPSQKRLHLFLQHFLAHSDWLPGQVRLSVDIDPLQFS